MICLSKVFSLDFCFISRNIQPDSGIIGFQKKKPDIRYLVQLEKAQSGGRCIAKAT